MNTKKRKIENEDDSDMFLESIEEFRSRFLNTLKFSTRDWKDVFSGTSVNLSEVSQFSVKKLSRLLVKEEKRARLRFENRILDHLESNESFSDRMSVLFDLYFETKEVERKNLILLIDKFFSSSSSSKNVELQRMRRKEEKFMMEQAENVTHAYLCGIRIPIEVILIIMSFIDHDYSVLCGLGTVNYRWYRITLETWGHVNIWHQYLSIPTILLRNVRSVRFVLKDDPDMGNAGLDDERNLDLEYVFKHLNLPKLQNLDFSGLKRPEIGCSRAVTHKKLEQRLVLSLPSLTSLRYHPLHRYNTPQSYFSRCELQNLSRLKRLGCDIKTLEKYQQHLPNLESLDLKIYSSWGRSYRTSDNNITNQLETSLTYMKVIFSCKTLKELVLDYYKGYNFESGLPIEDFSKFLKRNESLSNSLEVLRIVSSGSTRPKHSSLAVLDLSKLKKLRVLEIDELVVRSSNIDVMPGTYWYHTAREYDCSLILPPTKLEILSCSCDVSKKNMDGLFGKISKSSSSSDIDEMNIELRMTKTDFNDNRSQWWREKKKFFDLVYDSIEVVWEKSFLDPTVRDYLVSHVKTLRLSLNIVTNISQTYLDTVMEIVMDMDARILEIYDYRTRSKKNYDTMVLSSVFKKLGTCYCDSSIFDLVLMKSDRDIKKIASVKKETGLVKRIKKAKNIEEKYDDMDFVYELKRLK